MPTRLRPLWVWDKHETRLYKKLIIGYTLHVCSGKSNIGDIKVDLYEKSDVKAHLKHLPFRRFSFDTVICDPPFKYYSKFKWIIDLSDLARKRLILISPNVKINLKNFKLTPYFVDKPSRFMYKLCLIYDRIVNPLDFFTR